MIETKEVGFSYSSAPGFRYPDLHCTVQAPLLITGRSGCGKTTLLHLLAGLLSPREGHIYIDGTDITQLTERKLDRFRGTHVGIVFQRSHFLAGLSVLNNILLPQYCSGHATTAARATDIAQRLHIGHLLQKRPPQLSQGEQQRVSIARALVNDPRLIIADEPTSSLDDDNTATVVQLLKEQATLAGAALILVTHDERVKQHFQQHIHLS